MSRHSWMSQLYAISMGLFFFSEATVAQWVQLPTLNTFSIDSSVSVPDSGSGYLGSTRNQRAANTGQGFSQAAGRTSSGTSTSVHATIIDLDELDQMIRAHSGPRPTKIALSKTYTERQPYMDSRAKAVAPPAYAYMLAMNPGTEGEAKALDDAKYYMALASDAKQKKHWGSVELYYRLAWRSLPEHRRRAAWQDLMEAKEKAARETRSDKEPQIPAANPGGSNSIKL